MLLEQGLAGLGRDVLLTLGGSEWSGYGSIVKRCGRCKRKRSACWLGLLVGKGGEGGEGESQGRMSRGMGGGRQGGEYAQRELATGQPRAPTTTRDS